MAAKVNTEQWLDPRWRLNNLYTITDKKGAVIPFRMNDSQAELFDDIHYMNVILKARQRGFTTFLQLVMLDRCLFHSDQRCGTIAHTRDDAEIIFRDKVKFPYSQLPDGLKAQRPVTKDSASELMLNNNSSLRVGTSMRSGTLQMLHISEYGKICAKFPEKAREIRTGALNTVQAGQYVFIESTAEGQGGDFYDTCQEAQSIARMKTVLSPLDWKFHFFPWFDDPEYVLDPKDVVIPEYQVKYFDKLKRKFGISLTDEQKAWYVKKAAQQGDDMKREYPSTPKEAFEAKIEGAYYGDDMAALEVRGRICEVPHDADHKVETWWDLGMNDSTSIWFVQYVGLAVHVIDYYENSGEGLPHYVKKLEELKKERGYLYGRHIMPHDVSVRDLGTGLRREDVLSNLGVESTIAPKLLVQDGIEKVRSTLPKCYFDEARCKEGIVALKSYQKEFDERHGIYKDNPKKSPYNHAADAFRMGCVMDGPEEDNWAPMDYPDMPIV